MNDNLKLSILVSAMLVALSLPPLHASPPQHALGHERVALVEVPSPVQQSLLHLVGLVGRGRALMFDPVSQTCKAMQVRVVAGGFWGLEQTHKGQPIRMIIRDPVVVQHLLEGAEVVSDEHAIFIGHTDSAGGIAVPSGLRPGTGFVINPGHSTWAELFGARIRTVPCRHLRRVYSAWAR